MSDQKTIVIAGASGAIGQALVLGCLERYPGSSIHALQRHSGTSQANHNVKHHSVDYLNEEDLAGVAKLVGEIDIMIVAVGTLHDNGSAQPEKAIRALSAEQMQRLYTVNTIIPGLLIKHFSPFMNRDRRSVLAALSARVGSISDNALGGWYSYRCSKAALNMLIKTASIEVTRKNPSAIVIGLHPGTVESSLSKPFLGNVPSASLLSPDQSAKRLLDVLDGVEAQQSGSLLAYDGREIAP